MRVQLSDHFTYKRLFRFVVPSIFMMVFVSIYGVIDGLFISNFVGKTPFAAVNLIMPVLLILGAIGTMMGSGGSAIISQKLGEGDKKAANAIFSFIVYFTFIIGAVIAVIGEILIPYLAKWVGADENLYDYCVLYGRIILCAMPLFMLQYAFQMLMVTAEKSALGFVITVGAGCTNIVLDALFVVAFRWGVTGAAVATVISYAVGALVPIAYFFSKNTSLLRLGKPIIDGKVLLKTCTNGSSEFVTNVSTSVVGMVFNWQLLRLAGENGVAAYGVLMYVSYVFIGILYGYAVGVAPVIGYNYGAKNTGELKNIYRKSLLVMGILGVSMTVLAIALASPLAALFVGYDEELFALTKNAIFLYAFSFLFAGFGIFVSSLFTALGNGLISAVVSFLRTLVFQVAAVIILPIFWEITGAWLSMLFAEFLATVVAFIFCIAKKNRYGY